jgi:hypothetical protein
VRLNEAAVSHLLLAQALASAAAAPPVSHSVVQPLSRGRYKVQFTASAEFHDKLERLKALMASRMHDCDLTAVIEQAVTEKLERLEARRFAQTKAPRKTGGGDSQTGTGTGTGKGLDRSPSSRHIPAAVRRAVRQRDGDQCRYVNEQGRRCPERYGLEFHHRRPFGLGGGHGVANIGLLCRAHNGYMAQLDYGREAMARRRRPRTRASQPMAG